MDAETQEKLINAEKLRREVNEILTKSSELETESNEHGVVIETIKDLDPGRKCFRLIGGVLVEQTVGEVLPAVKLNKVNIDKLISKFHEEAKKKENLADEILQEVKQLT